MYRKTRGLFFHILLPLVVGATPCAMAAQAAGDESILNADGTRSQLQRLFARGDWAAMDQMGNKLVHAYEENPNQFAALRTFFVLLPNAVSPSTLAGYNAWVAQFPQSYAALYARARCYAFLALAARGGEFIEKVRPDQIQNIEKYFAASRADLLHSLTLSSRPVMTYFQLIRIARYAGTSQDTWSYYEKSTQLDPDILIIADQFLLSLQETIGEKSKWHPRELVDAAQNNSNIAANLWPPSQ